MSIPSWPATMPQELLMSGYSESPPNVALRTSMDIGPAKLRRRSTSAVRPITGEQIITTSQLADFKLFYNTDLLGGTLRFSWTDPVTEVAAEMRFSEPPSWAPEEGFYRLRMSLEILP